MKSLVSSFTHHSKRLRSSFCYQLFGERYYHCFPNDNIKRRVIGSVLKALFVL